jgi:hypothetical protein
MILTFFILFLALAFVLIALGLFKPEHTELSLIGFVFLFLLSMQIIAGNISYNSGTNTTSYFAYTPNYESLNLTLLTSSNETVVYNYTPMVLDGVLAHLIGYWLAVISIVGFIGVILSIRKGGY